MKPNPKFSPSEDHGIKSVPKDAVNILSVGVSTFGNAEIEMARTNKKRKIVATTIDELGLASVKKIVNKLRERGKGEYL